MKYNGINFILSISVHDYRSLNSRAKKSKLTNNFERKGLIQFWLCGDLTFKSSCISGRHVFQFERPLAMPGGNQLVAVIVDETVPSNEKHV